jgi:hypothetical protein
MVRPLVTPSSLALAASLALALAACTPSQAPAMRRSGEVMALGGVAGIIGAALVTGAVPHAREMLIGFEGISAIGILTFAYADLTWPRVEVVPETLEQRHHRWAKILTERAAGAAREGRCPRVRRLEVRVQQYDRIVHDAVLMKDPEILKCLSSPEPGEAPAGEAPVAPPVDAPAAPPVDAPAAPPAEAPAARPAEAPAGPPAEAPPSP